MSPTPAPSAGVDGSVRVMATAAGKVFLGGRFSKVGGAAHRSLGAVSASSGTVVNSWRADVAGTVNALATDGTTLFIGGEFNKVGGAFRANLAAVRVSDGAVLPWNPGANRPVEALAVGAGKVFVGGRFQTVAGRSASNLAALSPSSGQQVPGFRANATSFVFSLKVASSGLLYVGGAFQGINGVTRPRLAAVSTSTGNPTGWRPNVGCPVYDFALTSGTVYVGCGGGRQTGNRISAVSTSSGAVQWTVNTDGNVQTVVLSSGGVYAGGHFGKADGQIRRHAVAIDPSGRLLGWAPRFNSALGVWSMLSTGGNLFVGGDFTTVNDAPRPHLARFPAS